MEEVVRAAAGRLVLPYFPTSSRLSQPNRYVVAALSAGSDEIDKMFEAKQALLAVARGFFACSNQCPEKIISVIGSNPQKAA